MTAIRPSDMLQAKKDHIPVEVIAIFNEMIIENIQGKRASFKQDAVVARIAELMGVDRNTIFSKRWLDVEPIFREAGWKVEYDAPGYNESYGAFYVFSH